MLKWASESEYFEDKKKFEIFFADTRPTAITLPLAAHAQRGVIKGS